ncbi:SGNH/GDSL hydrolase family protein [Kineosporia rhizophila]|uniref:SGNH/GDSL hydrolase family protein n=1 Tax=Kineosporia TaxID=49184 RepID=UPI000B08B919|nr:SGNH/GDSL hydrolase family protein [Kineosporia sp. NBRC 101677]MCE0537713.1 SGNH/GDSL hydrolase family protein [Kineosporia rhizophila]GLY15688.1 lipase 1 [Kineosporia sp. NBRC 101677]
MRKIVLTAVAAVMGLTMLGATPASAHQRGEYVALGDSYASGVGASVYDEASGECLRSPKSYPRTWSRKHPKLKLKDVACSGYRIPQVRAEQLGALSRKTKLVTLTVGGNDAGFRATLNACLGGTDAQCQGAAALATNYASTTLVDDLKALLGEIKGKAPNARVIVLGYPHLVDPEGTDSCGDVTPNAERRALFTSTVDAVNQGIITATGQAGVKFVDLRGPFAGHEVCTDDPWLHEVDLDNQLEMFHPTDRGYKTYARELAKVTGRY